MSKPTTITQKSFDKYDAAEYLRSLGFRSITHHTVMYAHKTGKLKGAKPRGKAFHWSKESLDEYADLSQ